MAFSSISTFNSHLTRQLRRIFVYINYIYPTYYYPFDSDTKDYASGVPVTDVIVTGTFSQNTSFKRGTGALLTSTTSYLSLPSMTMKSTGFSICMWWYFTGASGSRVFEFSNAFSNAFYIYVNTNNELIYQDESTGSNTPFGSPLVANTWYHIAMVLSPLSNTAQSYFNGSQSTTYTNTYNTVKATTRNNNMLGYNYQNSTGFAAGYDDVRVYNGVVLTASQISELNAGNAYTFRIKGSSSTVPTKDYNGNTVTNTNSVTMFNDPIRGYVFNLSGSNYLSISVNQPTNITRTFWLSSSKPTFDNENVYSSSKFPVLFLGTNKLNFWPNFSSGNKIVSSTIQMTTWVFYAITLSPTSMSLYLNGSLSADNTVTETWTGDSAEIQFGAYQGGSTYKGYIDDMRLYPSILTPDQIRTIYNEVDVFR